MDLTSVLSLGFMQRALIAGLLVATAAAVVGNFVVLRGMSLLGDSLAHASFGGIALGLFLGVSPFHMAVLAAVAGGIAVYILENRLGLRADTALGMVFAAGLGLGVIVVSTAGGFNVNLLSFLFGSILTVSWMDVVAFSLLLTLLVGVLVVLFKEYLFLTFDEEAAEASGLPVDGLNLLFITLTALAVVVSIKIVGVLLVSGLLVVPAAASHRLARSFRQALAIAILIAISSSFSGVFLAYALNWPPGGAILVVSLGLFAAVVAGKRVWKWMCATPAGRSTFTQHR